MKALRMKVGRHTEVTGKRKDKTLQKKKYWKGDILPFSEKLVKDPRFELCEVPDENDGDGGKKLRRG